VGRSTFYAHFRDKDDLLVSGFEELRETLRAAMALYDAAPKRTRWFHAQRAAMGASLAALEGRRAEAASSFADAIRQWRAITAPFDLAMTELFYALLIGTAEPEAARAAAEAREIFGGLRATAYLERLEPTLVTAALSRG
jgi:AcrR family transcriptional regulator